MARIDIANLEDGAPGEVNTSADAFLQLGMIYSTGSSVPADYVAAHKWFNLAALKGRCGATALRREVAEQMSDEEIARAQREARAWITTH